jgi:hypothetical protein
MPARKRSRIALTLLALAVGALTLDRIILYLWAHQVISLYRSLRSSVATGADRPPQARFGYVSLGLEPLLVAPKSEQWPVRYLTLRTDGTLAKPSTITVDGEGGLHLRFLPPRAAWTTWLIPRGDSGHHADPVSMDPRLHYQYKIDIDTSAYEVTVLLSRGPYHFAEPLKPDEQHPLLFP